MTRRLLTTHLAIVGRSNLRRHRDPKLEPARRAAYRRLAVAMLGLDVATLADELRTARLRADRSDQLAA
jgi:hypothetical protein